MVLNPLKPEWPQEVAALIERVVGKVRSLFTNKAVLITNGLVFGSIAIAGALVAAVLGITMLFRSIQSYLTWDMDTTAQVIIGILALVGLAVGIAGLVTANPGLTALGALVFFIAGTRWLLDITETFVDHDTAVWISYMIIGGWLMLMGAYFMLQRREPRDIV